MSLSWGKTERVFWELALKDWGFLNLGLFSMCIHVQHTHELFHMVPMASVEQGELM